MYCIGVLNLHIFELLTSGITNVVNFRIYTYRTRCNIKCPDLCNIIYFNTTSDLTAIKTNATTQNTPLVLIIIHVQTTQC